jgi:L-asparaginase
VLVAMGGAGGLRLHAADKVAKVHATAVGAFRTREGLPIGRVDPGGQVRIRQRGSRRGLPGVPASAAEPVEIVVAAIGIGAGALDRATAAGARGVVVAATGAGNTHPDLLRSAVRAMDAGVVVALATRTRAGSVGPHYAFPGGGTSWLRAGVLAAGDLTPVQARIALALGIGAGLGGRDLADLLAGPR